MRSSQTHFGEDGASEYNKKFEHKKCEDRTGSYILASKLYLKINKIPREGFQAEAHLLPPRLSTGGEHRWGSFVGAILNSQQIQSFGESIICWVDFQL